jgi:hypothetical protein
MPNTMTPGPSISKSAVSPTTQPNQKRSSFSPKGQHGNTKRFSGKRNSRYAKKKHGNRNVKPVVALRGPVFEYISSCCILPARKPRTGSEKVQQGRQQVFGEQKEKKQSEKNGLGGWRCSGCNKPTKVRPQKPTPKSVEVTSANLPV